MSVYKKLVEVRWSDLDPNFHLKHSAYYDFGAYCRMCFLIDNGATPALFMQHKTGPVLLREECIFKREIHFGDEVIINLKLKKANRDLSRWSMVHEIWKNQERLSAIINIDGAWIDTEKRKLISAPLFTAEAFERLDKADDFEWLS